MNIKYPYITWESNLSLEEYDICCNIEDLFIQNKFLKPSKSQTCYKKFIKYINKTIWAMLIHTFNTKQKPDKVSKYLYILGIDSINSYQKKRIYWYCRCVCNKIVSISEKHLKSGHTKSCGCLSTYIRKETNIKKYNYEHTTQVPKFKEKIKKTCLDRYGSEHPKQILHLDKVKDLHFKKKKTCPEIAKILKVSNSAVVSNFLNRHGYDVIDYYSKLRDLTKEKLLKLHYEEQNTQAYIANKLKVTPRAIKTKLDKFSIKPKYYGGISLPHQLLIEKLEEKGFNVQVNNRSILKDNKELDIVLLKYNLAIEVNGVFWHSMKPKNYHLNKTLETYEAGITLLHFWDYEILNNLNLVISMITSKCGLTKRIFARKTEVKELEHKETSEFIKENHIQGSVNASIKLGLFYEKELVAVMTLGKARYSNYDWELLRFCCKQSYTVIGGFSKLLTYFTRRYKGTLVSYANRRISTGKVYEANNFKLSHISAPCYYYFKKNNSSKLYHRSMFQKHKLENLLDTFDARKTEFENMVLNGYARVWDCGNLVYVIGD